MIMKVIDTQKIVVDIQKLHPDLKIIEFYKNSHLIVEDEYGKCKVQIHSLLNNSKPTINTALNKTLYFKNKMKLMSPDIEIISSYNGALNKIKIKNKYGICSCIANNLLKGQIPSIVTAINKTEYFINMAKEIHGDRYDYSLVDYKNSKTNVKIICKKHGIFQQLPQTHLINKGCKKCGDMDKTGWWYKNPKNAERKSNFYILQFTGNDENFMKFGVSIDTLKRIKTLNRDCKHLYEITLIKNITNTVNYCYKIEERFKYKIKKHNKTYIPTMNFCGKNECFI